MHKVGIIGLGRFGKLWASILSQDFPLLTYDPDVPADSKAADLPAIFACNTVFYCLPISNLEAAMASHRPLLEASPTKPLIADVCSLKVYPKEIMERLLPGAQQALLTHPMFGPDSVNKVGLAGQRIVIDKFRCSDENYRLWCEYFQKKELSVIAMTADEHDRLAARSQGLVHFIGRTLERLGFSPTDIDTMTASQLHEIVSHINNDSWQLFNDMQQLNPYAADVRSLLIETASSLDVELRNSKK